MELFSLWQEEESLQRFYESRCAAISNSVAAAASPVTAAAAAATDESNSAVDADQDAQYEVTHL